MRTEILYSTCNSELSFHFKILLEMFAVSQSKPCKASNTFQPCQITVILIITVKMTKNLSFYQPLCFITFFPIHI